MGIWQPYPALPQPALSYPSLIHPALQASIELTWIGLQKIIKINKKNEFEISTRIVTEILEVLSDLIQLICQPNIVEAQ